MVQAIPADTLIACPRCGFSWLFMNINGGQTYLCSGCEWRYALTAVAPTSALSAGIAAGAVALPVASGGASFTGGMVLLLGVGTAAEVVQVTATGSATSIPVTPVAGGHLIAATFGKLAVAPFFSAIQAAQPVSPYPASQPGTF